MPGEPLRGLLLVGRLQRVVQFLADPLGQLIHQRLDVHPTRQRRHHLRQPPDLLEVAAQRLVRPRVLHLDRDHPAVGPDGPVDLADRGRSRRSRFERLELRAPVRPQLPRQHRVHPRRRHRRGGVLQPGELVAVRGGHVLRQRGLEQAHRLAELHRAALEFAQHPEQLFRRPLLHLLGDRFGGAAADALAESERSRGRRSRAGGTPAGPRGGRPTGPRSPGPLPRAPFSTRRQPIPATDSHTRDEASTTARPSRTAEQSVPGSRRTFRAVARPESRAPAPPRPRPPSRRATAGDATGRPLELAQQLRPAGSASRRVRSVQCRQHVRPGSTSGPIKAPAGRGRTSRWAASCRSRSAAHGPVGLQAVARRSPSGRAAGTRVGQCRASRTAPIARLDAARRASRGRPRRRPTSPDPTEWRDVPTRPAPTSAAGADPGRRGPSSASPAAARRLQQAGQVGDLGGAELGGELPPGPAAVEPAQDPVPVPRKDRPAASPDRVRSAVRPRPRRSSTAAGSSRGRSSGLNRIADRSTGPVGEATDRPWGAVHRSSRTSADPCTASPDSATGAPAGAGTPGR